MKLTRSLEQLKERVSKLNTEKPNISVAEIAQSLEITEGEATLALPSEFIFSTSGTYTQSILEMLPEWGMLTTIVHSCGSIFEAKAPFPKGKVAHGYYNLMGGKNGELHGHLKIDAITDVIFVSKPFRGMESYFIGFYDNTGQCAFKIYLGRDKKRALYPEQIERFKAIQKEYI